MKRPLWHQAFIELLRWLGYWAIAAPVIYVLTAILGNR